MIVLDTSVLSKALRRKRTSHHSDPVTKQLEALLRENVPVAIPGVVAQELLSGVRHEEQFLSLRQKLEAFPLVVASMADHVEAARLINRCRAGGMIIGTIDALIAAMTLRIDAQLFTLDRDFSRIAEIAPLRLFPLAS